MKRFALAVMIVAAVNVGAETVSVNLARAIITTSDPRYVNASGDTMTGALLGVVGSAAAPSFAFFGEADTGFFLSAANSAGVATAGVERWSWNASGAFNPTVSNTYDIGGSTTIRDIGIGRSAVFSGSTSGTTTLSATAVAGTTALTLPAATDTLVGRATTDTLTNKTLTAPVLTSPTTDTLQTSGNIGVKVAPSGNVGDVVLGHLDGNQGTRIRSRNADAASTGSFASMRAEASTATINMIAYGAGNTSSSGGLTAGNYTTLLSTAGNGQIIGNSNAALITFITNDIRRMTIAGTGGVSLDVNALTAGAMTSVSECLMPSCITCRTWSNAQVVALGATTTGDIAFGTLPAKTIVRNAYVVLDAGATAPTTLTVSVGRTSASYIDYIVASDAKASANTVYGDASAERGTNLTGYDLPSYTGTTLINAHFVSSGGDLSAVTNSAGRVCIATDKLP